MNLNIYTSKRIMASHLTPSLVLHSELPEATITASGGVQYPPLPFDVGPWIDPVEVEDIADAMLEGTASAKIVEILQPKFQADMRSGNWRGPIPLISICIRYVLSHITHHKVSKGRENGVVPIQTCWFHISAACIKIQVSRRALCQIVSYTTHSFFFCYAAS